MTERELVDLGFHREVISDEISDSGVGFHYYTYGLGSLEFVLMSTASHELIDNDWRVEGFDSELVISTSSYKDVKDLIDIFERNKVI